MSDLTTAEIDALAPVFIGPTWLHDSDGWILPARNRTLGWHIAGWAHEYLRHGDGSAWVFTPEQFRFLLWWFAFLLAGAILRL